MYNVVISEISQWKGCIQQDIKYEPQPSQVASKAEPFMYDRPQKPHTSIDTDIHTQI